MSLLREYQASKPSSPGLEALSLTGKAFGFGHFSSPQFRHTDHCFLPSLLPRFHHSRCLIGALAATSLPLTGGRFSPDFVLEPKSEIVRAL